jgi:hypothetical protein
LKFIWLDAKIIEEAQFHYFLEALNMRYKRKDHFQRMRRKKAGKAFLLTIVMPSLLIILGYLVAAVIILPAMAG